MQIASVLLCLILFVIVVAVLMIFFLVSRKKDAQPTEEQSAKRIQHRSKAWMAYIVIALFLAIWSIIAALFFLAVVWIMRKNPTPNSSSTVGDNQKGIARRVYTWLFFSSIITVPIFLAIVVIAYSGDSTANQHVLSALVPLIFHVPLLLGLTSKSTFVYRHTQQGILLIAVRAGIAALALGIGDYPEDGLWLFLLGNGSLWLFGSIWGWGEIKHGTYWWRKQKDEAISKGETVQTQIKPEVSRSPEQGLDYSKWYVRHNRKQDATQCALQAFRHGDPETRRQAVRLLDDLNEIEFF